MWMTIMKFNKKAHKLQLAVNLYVIFLDSKHDTITNKWDCVLSFSAYKFNMIFWKIRQDNRKWISFVFHTIQSFRTLHLITYLTNRSLLVSEYKQVTRSRHSPSTREYPSKNSRWRLQRRTVGQGGTKVRQN